MTVIKEGYQDTATTDVIFVHQKHPLKQISISLASPKTQLSYTNKLLRIFISHFLKNPASHSTIIVFLWLIQNIYLHKIPHKSSYSHSSSSHDGCVTNRYENAQMNAWEYESIFVSLFHTSFCVMKTPLVSVIRLDNVLCWVLRTAHTMSTGL